jgi:sulfur-carrier protein adenylyltransferase/sulfurtransferase
MDLLRYARHLTLPEVGAAGQERLGRARVLLVGAGGLGSPAALYLAAAGVGTLGIIDGDRVDVTNLQRQILHGTSDVGRAKVESAADRLGDLNPGVEIEPHGFTLTSANAVELFRRYDIIVDGSDNFPTRYLVNDAAILAGKPYVYGSIFKFDGQVSVFGAAGGPCYRCLFAEPPAPELIPSCAEAGVLGVLPGIIGSLQALETIKLILGIGTPLVGRLLMFDGLALTTRELRVHRDPACTMCGDAPSITAPIDYEAFCGITAARSDAEEITPEALETALEGASPPEVIDVREQWEWEVAHIAGSRHIPLTALPARVSELDARREIITVCHRGARSLSARRLLAGAGFARVKSLAGGIDAYAARVDPKLSRY